MHHFIPVSVFIGAIAGCSMDMFLGIDKYLIQCIGTFIGYVYWVVGRCRKISTGEKKFDFLSGFHIIIATFITFCLSGLYVILSEFIGKNNEDIIFEILLISAFIVSIISIIFHIRAGNISPAPTDIC